MTKILVALAILTIAASQARGNVVVGSFCDALDKEVEYQAQEEIGSIWSAKEVQQFILDEANNLKCTPNSAYIFAYKRMTKARDKARCGNDPDMTPNNFQNEIFNDALSDLMSRYFVNTWSVCNRHDSHSFPTGADIGNMWCNLAKQSHDHNLNSIHVAMASTAIYLTTHMGLAVSALVQADNLWEQLHVYDTLEKRASFLAKNYRPLYDGFNSFLSEHLNTVETALHDFGLTRGKAFSLMATIASEVDDFNSIDYIFDKIRSKTFDLGLRLGVQIPREDHPLLVECPNYVNGAPMKYCLRTSFLVPESLNYVTIGSLSYKQLIGHGKFWRRLLADDLGPVYKRMGALDWADLEKGSGLYNECIEAVWKNKFL
eukprot:g16129.t1